MEKRREKSWSTAMCMECESFSCVCGS